MPYCRRAIKQRVSRLPEGLSGLEVPCVRIVVSGPSAGTSHGFLDSFERKGIRPKRFGMQETAWRRIQAFRFRGDDFFLLFYCLINFPFYPFGVSGIFAYEAQDAGRLRYFGAYFFPVCVAVHEIRRKRAVVR